MILSGGDDPSILKSEGQALLSGIRYCYEMLWLWENGTCNPCMSRKNLLPMGL